MKEIKLTQGFMALVDDEDYEWLSQWKWHIMKFATTKYAARTDYYKDGRPYSLRMHRAIMGIKDKKILVDHMDTNGLNNQKSNLRICNTGQNSSNRRSAGTRTSVYKGVNKTKSNKWMASIRANGKTIYLGVFEFEKDAAIAYNEEAIKQFGEFALLNNINN